MQWNFCFWLIACLWIFLPSLVIQTWDSLSPHHIKEDFFTELWRTLVMNKLCSSRICLFYLSMTMNIHIHLNVMWRIYQNKDLILAICELFLVYCVISIFNITVNVCVSSILISYQSKSYCKNYITSKETSICFSNPLFLLQDS